MKTVEGTSRSIVFLIVVNKMERAREKVVKAGRTVHAFKKKLDKSYRDRIPPDYSPPVNHN